MELYLPQFLILAGAIALVGGALKRDKPREILLEATRIFAYLLIGVLAFCAYAALLPIFPEWV